MGCKLTPTVASIYTTAYGVLAKGVPRTPMSFQIQGTLSTSLGTGIGHAEEVVAVTASHGTGGTLAH